MKSSQKQAVAMAKQVGLEVMSVCQSGGSHVKCKLRRADGTEALFFFALTPSDKRAEKNNLCFLRRFARGDYTPVMARAA